MMNVEIFSQLDTESQNYIIDEVANNDIKIEPNNQHYAFIQKVSCFTRLFQILSTAESSKRIGAIYENNRSSLIKFILENSKLFTINRNIYEHLYKKNSLKKSLIDIFNNIDGFLINMEYPAKSFEQISEIIYDVTKQNKKFSDQIQILITVGSNDYLEKKFDINKIISVIHIQPSVTKFVRIRLKDAHH